ncbi:sigma-54-dependent Fis family transcriptional regulator [Arthrobacter sp. P2b]|uniref:sigma-54-dependent Fis family transcriptional regulator n=1 Tax=Arthrobacter sp. P2b TaxID=1938741 RepID=UPI0009A74C77|nr:sigma 54-interacting transcriptional regulator [Arthrobacter sp. P2b]SLK13680.1 Sigma-54 interaction domain-containing protein [Arthrobacter sp. P2b]
MPWVIDLSGGQAWAREAITELRTANLVTETVDAPVGGSATGIILSAADSQNLKAALGAAEYNRCRVLVIGPPDGKLKPWPVLEEGAAECITWHSQVAAISAWMQRVEDVEAVLDSVEVREKLTGQSPVLRSALRDLVVAARFGQAPILIQGETGTGKELAARVAHAVSLQPGNLVTVDCTTIVPTLMGSELFGHERGAFTGAVSVRTGACSGADQGSLFLDEVGELPLDLQPELLRVVQEGAYKRVGGDRWLRSKFRLICATNRDLSKEVAAGSFRTDLYHRIAASVVTMPPLRERIEDILCLFARFCREASGARTDPEVDTTVQDVLLRRTYPGNLRDLRQLAFRIAARHVGPGAITPGDLPREDRPTSMKAFEALQQCQDTNDGGPASAVDPLTRAVARAVDAGLGLREIKERAAEIAVDVALQQSGGNVHAAAAMLGLTDRAVQQRQARKTGHDEERQYSTDNSSATSRQ